MAKVHTGARLIAVSADPKQKRHVTADRLVALCGLEIPAEWYTGDAGEFGKAGDCTKCTALLTGQEAEEEPAEEPSESENVP